MDLSSDPDDKLKYPKSVWFIVLNELCERFSYYGLRTVLMLYLTTVLMFDGDYSTIIYHSFIFLAYFMPLPGAILADSHWGKFKTIIRLSIVYALGSVILAGSALADAFSLDAQKIVALLGLFLISVGTGGIKPCVFAFGGDQFQFPRQEQQLLHYTTTFLVAVNVGALASTFLTPELRQSVHCFGKDTCYPLAFGVPAVLMLIAIVIFVSGKNMYVKKKPEHEVISRTFGCIFYALRTKLTSSAPCESHWLDNAKGVYAETEISDTKKALNAIVRFTAYPVFWALYEQQGSRWTLQAMQMNGRVDLLDWTIKPDQMQTLIPFLGLIFLFLFDVAFYPMLAVVGVRRPFQKLALSGCLAVTAFIFAAVLQLKIFGNTTVIPSGEGRLNIYNGFDCDAFVRSSSNADRRIGALEMINVSYTPVTREHIVRISLRFDPACTYVPEYFQLNSTVTVLEAKEVSYYLTRSNQNTISLDRVGDYDYLIKDKFGHPNLRILIDHTFDFNDGITLNRTDENSLNSYSISSLHGTNFKAVNRGKYNLFDNGRPIFPVPVDLIPATFYTLTLQRNGDKTDAKLFTSDEGEFIHILWQIPQFLCMIMADVIFVVTTVEFSFTEAPMNLKSFVSAISLLTTSVGNLLVVIISSLSIRNQAYEYFLYSGLMFADTLLIVYFSVVYRNRSINNNDATSLDENKKNEITAF